MALSTSLVQKIKKGMDKLAPEIIQLAKDIHSHPELVFHEIYASGLLTSYLKKFGFKITNEAAGLKTAFSASLPSPKKSPTIALIAEYDALPGLGHACGHNMIAAISAGTGAVLAKAGLQEKAIIKVIGTPAEEGGGGKIMMIEKGGFDGIDVALMTHPSNHTRIVARMLAIIELTFTFTGKSSHAAASPSEGINALDAAILTFNNINALRQQIRDDARIHGIITEGGKAPNIIPGRAEAVFYVRSIDMDYFHSLVKRVKKCASAAAMGTGCKLRMKTGKVIYHPFQPNYTLGKIFQNHLESFGVGVDDIGEAEGIGSSDIGNVSQIMPTLHAEFSITMRNQVNHSPEFTKCAISEYGLKQMITAAKSLALTVAELIESPEKLKLVKQEFKNNSPSHNVEKTI